MTTRGLRAAVAVAAGALLLFGTAGCSAERTESNELKLVYKSGMGDDRVFDRCIAPSTAGDPPYDNDVFTLPTDRRTWNVQPTPGSDETQPYVMGPAPMADPDTHKSRSGPQVAVWFTTDFYLNWDCGFDLTKSLSGQKGTQDSPVVRFFDRTGRTAQISSDSGGFDIDKWRTLLRSTMALVERDVLQQQTKKYDSDTLKDNIGDVYEKMEAQLAPAFQEKLNEKVGGDYFCGIEYDGGKNVTWREPVLDAQGNPSIDPVTKLPVTKPKTGKCPPVRIDITNIDLASAEIQTAADQAYVAEQNAKAARVKAESDKAVAGLATDPNVLKLKEMENERAIADAQAKACQEAAGGCTVIQGDAGRMMLPAR
jgi:hypothetical protein